MLNINVLSDRRRNESKFYQPMKSFQLDATRAFSAKVNYKLITQYAFAFGWPDKDKKQP